MEQKLPVRPYDEMSTTGAMTRVTDVPRPIVRLLGPRSARAGRAAPDAGARRAQPCGHKERESQDYEDFGGGHQGRPAKKFKDGGMVRGTKPGQTSGTKFSGTF
jgi:hypothetical protein